MKTYAFILAGGKGTRLDLLAFHRDKPAVMFAGKYRIIDFCLSNLANSNIFNIGILTHKEQIAINDYINSGLCWYKDIKNIDKVNVNLLHPKNEKYLGTADAVYQNLDILKNDNIEYVLILSGDQIYKMDYQKVIDFHISKNADLTICSINVDKKDTHRFGILETDKNFKVLDFKEKPTHTTSTLASMGIYVFKKDILITFLNKLINMYENLDFGKHVIPEILNNKNNIYTYQFEGYWQDVGTYDSYLNASLDLNKNLPELTLDDSEWKIYTNFEQDLKTKLTSSSYIERSIISNGSIIKGTVINSIISPGVIIEKGAQVKDSIILNNSKIEKGSTIYRTIIDKNCIIGKNAIIGFGNKDIFNTKYPNLLKTGITVIEKNSHIKQDIIIGTNCRIFNKANLEDIKIVKDGQTLE